METGWIVAIVLGSLLVIVVIIVIAVWVHSMNKKKKMSTMEEYMEHKTEPKKSKYNHEKWDNLLKSIEKHQQKEIHYQAM